MFSINQSVNGGDKYVISLDDMDLALLPIPLHNRDDSSETIPIWRLHKSIESDHMYFEFEVHTQNKKDTEAEISKNQAKENIVVDKERENMDIEDLDLDLYIKLLTKSNKSHPMHNLKAVNENLIEIKTIDGRKVQVSTDNFHSYVYTKDDTQCSICSKVVGRVKAAHKLTKTHLTLVNMPLHDANCCRKLDNIWSHCVICNEMIENVDLHSHDIDHRHRLKAALIVNVKENNANIKIDKKNSKNNYYITRNNTGGSSDVKKHDTKQYHCWTCNVFLTYSEKNIKEHNNSATHKSKLVKNVHKDQLTNINENPASFSTNASSPKTDSVTTRKTEVPGYSKDVTFASLTGNEAFCSICQRKMLKTQIETHLQGRAHKLMANAAKINNTSGNIPLDEKDPKPAEYRAKVSKATEENKIKDCEKPVVDKIAEERNKVHDIKTPVKPKSIDVTSVLLKTELVAHASSTHVKTDVRNVSHKALPNIADSIGTKDDSSVRNKKLCETLNVDHFNDSDSAANHTNVSQVGTQENNKVDNRKKPVKPHSIDPASKLIKTELIAHATSTTGVKTVDRDNEGVSNKVLTHATSNTEVMTVVRDNDEGVLHKAIAHATSTPGVKTVVKVNEGVSEALPIITDRIETKDDNSVRNKELGETLNVDHVNGNYSIANDATVLQFDNHTGENIDDSYFDENDERSLINTAAFGHCAESVAAPASTVIQTIESAPVRSEIHTAQEDEVSCWDWCCVCF